MPRYIDADELIQNCMTGITIVPGYEKQYIDAMLLRKIGEKSWK